MRRSVVIADDEPITRMDLIEILEGYGFDVIGSFATGLDAIECCRKERPSLVLMDIKMPLLDGIKASKIINEENLAECVMLLTAYSDEGMVKKAVDAGVTGYVIKPISENSLIPAIEVSMAKQRQIDSIKNEVIDLKEKIEDRKLIEKAKGMLCEQKKISEQQAYEYMRNISMNNGHKMAKIARAILLDLSDEG